MQREAVYDLHTTKPHAPPRTVFSPREWQVYCQGYYLAIAMALKVMDHAAVRFELYVRTKRLDRKRLKE